MLNIIRKILLTGFIAALGGTHAMAMEETPLVYEAEAKTFEGIFISGEEAGPLNGVSVLIAHDFLGPGENQLVQARSYAEQGANVLVADLYGQGRRPNGFEEANTFAIALRQDIPELRMIMTAALKALLEQGGTRERTLVIGTSVGGLAALELGRTGAKVGHIAVLWSVIENTAANTATAFQSPVTVMQGDADPLGTQAAIDELRSELDESDGRSDIVVFEGVAHAYTLPFVGDDPSTGFAYDQSAHDESNRILIEILAGL